MSYRGWAAFGCWLAALVGGLYQLADHQFTAGRSGSTPPRWIEPVSADRPTGRPRLLMFVHPHCPCTPSSLRNFAAVATETGCEGVIYIAAENLAGTPNGRLAARLPGVQVCTDATGVVARQFGTLTSGHVFLYTTDGRLVFEGGITAGRGHEGDSPGRRALVARLTGAEDQLVSLPVFGCPLHD